MYFSLGQYCDRAQLILQQKIGNWVHQNCTAIQPGPVNDVFENHAKFTFLFGDHFSGSQRYRKFGPSIARATLERAAFGGQTTNTNKY